MNVNMYENPKDIDLGILKAWAAALGIRFGLEPGEFLQSLQNVAAKKTFWFVTTNSLGEFIGGMIMSRMDYSQVKHYGLSMGVNSLGTDFDYHSLSKALETYKKRRCRLPLMHECTTEEVKQFETFFEGLVKSGEWEELNGLEYHYTLQRVAFSSTEGSMLQIAKLNEGRMNTRLVLARAPVPPKDKYPEGYNPVKEVENSLVIFDTPSEDTNLTKYWSEWLEVNQVEPFYNKEEVRFAFKRIPKRQQKKPNTTFKTFFGQNYMI